MAQHSRRFKAKVAPEIARNGYCATKKFYFYGVKLHVLATYEKKSLPIPEYIAVVGANEHDRKIHEQLIPVLKEKCVFADKAYQIENKAILEENDHMLYTPVKKQKGQRYLESADALLSTAISSIRQPHVF